MLYSKLYCILEKKCNDGCLVDENYYLVLNNIYMYRLPM